MDDERPMAEEHAEEPLSEEDLRRDEDERRATAQTERVSVVNEPQRSDDDEFRWHTGPTGRPAPPTRSSSSTCTRPSGATRSCAA